MQGRHPFLTCLLHSVDQVGGNADDHRHDGQNGTNKEHLEPCPGCPTFIGFLGSEKNSSKALLSNLTSALFSWHGHERGAALRLNGHNLKHKETQRNILLHQLFQYVSIRFERWTAKGSISTTSCYYSNNNKQFSWP
jgi:hypothetical protein